MKNLKPKKKIKSKETTQKPIKSFINKIIFGDALKVLKQMPSESIDSVITSPPYWALRDYGVKGQIGLESNLEDYFDKLISIFDEVKRVLKPKGTCFVNFGDTYANSTKGGQKNRKHNNLFDHFDKGLTIPKLKTNLKIAQKSLCMIPSRFAIKMIGRGWILRNEIIWHKTNAMPESVKDRFTRDFEKVFFFTKSKKYYFEQQFEPLKSPNELKRRYSNPFEKHKYWKKTRKSKKSLEALKKSQKEILKKGRNKRSVWQIATGNSKGNHFAVFPELLIETPIKAGCPKGGIVLDPFVGSGTTPVVAIKLGRKYIGIELNKDYALFSRRAADKVKKDIGVKKVTNTDHYLIPNHQTKDSP